MEVSDDAFFSTHGHCVGQLMATVYFNDHGTLACDMAPPKVCDISYPSVLKAAIFPESEEVGVLSEATHAVLHLGPEQWKKRKKEWCLENTRMGVGLIILKVSSDGKTQLETAEHDKWLVEGAERVAYILNARNQAQVLERDEESAKRAMRAFYAMTSEQAESVYSGNLENCDPELRKLFELPITEEILPALLILCQGYLVVQAGPDGNVEVSDSTTGIIATSLQQMGWIDALNTTAVTQSLIPALISKDPSERDTLRREVASPTFWNVFEINHNDGGESLAAFLSDAHQEWGRNPGFKPVADLIGRFGGEVNPPTVVAEAYLSLARKLGGSNVI